MTDAGDAFEPEWASSLPTDATSLDDAAVAYAELGFRVLPVWGVRRGRDGNPKCQCGQVECKRGKHPIGQAWQKHASSDVDRVRAARQGKPTANIGLAMGGEGRLVAVDIDGEPGRVSWDALEATHGPAPITLTSATGREDGGEHRVFRVPDGLDIARLRTRANAGKHTGIDTRIEGGQIVVAPSNHESGAVYRWTVRAPIAELPTWLYEALATPLATVTPLRPAAPRAPSSSPGSAPKDFARRYVEKALENSALDIAACPPGQRNDKLFAKSTTLFEYFIGENFDPIVAWNRLHEAGLACGMSDGEVRTTLAKARKRAEGKPRLVPSMPERPDHAFRPELADLPFEARAREHEQALSDEPEDDDPTWDTDLEHDLKGNLNCSLGNLVTILSRHPLWRGVIVWDDFASTIVKRKLPPVREGDRSPKIVLGEWNEGDSARAVTWIAKNYKIDPSTRTVEEALTIVAERSSCNLVREYLSSVVWDGTPRIDTFLSKYFTCPDTEYVRGVSCRWMISAVARAFEPGCDVDCVLVFEGQTTRDREGQGGGKSKGLRELVPERAWFADTPLVIGDKDSYQNLRGKWIYEIGELSGLKGRDVDRTKNFLSASVDNLRPSFGKRNRDFVRALVFAASTNDHHYLTDRTGNRRFWPVKVLGDVDRKAIGRDRDQLWAEAVHRYRAGEEWYANTPEFRALAREEQTERLPDSPWLGPIEAWLEHPWVTIYDPADGMKKTSKADLSYEGEGVTTTDVLQSAIGMRLTDIDRKHEIEAGNILRELGLETFRPRAGTRQRRYRWPVSGCTPPDGPIEGGGDWTGIGPEYSLSFQPLTDPGPMVQSDPLYTQGEKKSEIAAECSQDLWKPLGTLVLPEKNGVSAPEASPTPEPVQAAEPPAEPVHNVGAALTSAADRRAVTGILAKVRLGGMVAPSDTSTTTSKAMGSPPRATSAHAPPPNPRPSPPSPVQGPARGQGGPAPRPSQRALPRANDDDEDLLDWLDRQ